MWAPPRGTSKVFPGTLRAGRASPRVPTSVSEPLVDTVPQLAAPSEIAPRTAPAPGHVRRRGLVGVLLRFPLFYKILVANALIVVLGTVAGTWVTASYVRASPERSTLDLVGLLVLGGLVLSVLVNALILRLALSPLSLLEATAARVQRGELDARAPHSPVSDRELERLTRTFNGMLDSAALSRQRLRDVAARALHAAEEERKRIARELHDETAQMLAALLIRIRVVRNAGDPQALDTLLEEMRREIGESLEGIRRFARGLRPPALDELGLVAAVESHARSLAESVGVQVRVETDALDGVLSPEAELALYRIVQEALSNVVRHSGAARASVRLSRAPGVVAATVEDDGRGFSVANVLAGERRGLGLFGMQERAAYLGGKVTFRSRPGEGTRVHVEIPVADTN
jgi:two-component system sensor histidine kinase UhpB